MIKFILVILLFLKFIALNGQNIDSSIRFWTKIEHNKMVIIHHDSVPHIAEKKINTCIKERGGIDNIKKIALEYIQIKPYLDSFNYVDFNPFHGFDYYDFAKQSSLHFCYNEPVYNYWVAEKITSDISYLVSFEYNSNDSNIKISGFPTYIGKHQSIASPLEIAELLDNKDFYTIKLTYDKNIKKYTYIILKFKNKLLFRYIIDAETKKILKCKRHKNRRIIKQPSW